MDSRHATIFALVFGMMGAASAPLRGQTTQPASPDVIAELVARLGKGSYRQREQAVRQIAELGPAALPALRHQVRSTRHEAALAARELIEELDGVLFTGVSLRLELDPPRARWNEPFRLRVIAENRSDYEALLPWETRRPPTTAPADLAYTVGLTLDIAEFLEVVGPDDEPVELNVDTIGEDEAVERAVWARATSGPVRALAAGQRHEVELAAINRGWARYPLLAAGRYRFQLIYQPQWSREAWIDAKIGRVESNVVEIEVTEAAPDAILTAAGPVRLRVVRTNGQLVAHLANTLDVPQLVNLNFGTDPTLFAELRWSIRPPNDQSIVVTPPPTADSEPIEFDPKRLRLLEPLDEVEVGRIDVETLLATAAAKLPGIPRGDLQVAVRYANFCSRETLRRTADEATNERERRLARWAETLPHHVFTGSPGAEPTPLVEQE
ncbi:MAG: hypothetical protein JXA69_11095 [Phycisphaerae bacterium]|nr:hypothetical protein [Phycisphaerae bacterium]